VAKTLYSAHQEKLQALLRELRVEGALTQMELAEKLGLPQSFVSKYESGERLLDLVELRQICQALDVSLIQFISRWEGTLDEA
jgi:transcriptional regulator with XRE-family HTH domain